jgi:hypothetical protein
MHDMHDMHACYCTGVLSEYSTPKLGHTIYKSSAVTGFK